MRDYSPLVDSIRVPTGRYEGSRKWSDRPNGDIIGLVAHHHATTGMGGVSRLVSSNDPASANYILLSSGHLMGSVSERYRAWTSGSAEVDGRRITIEIQNQTAGPEWRVSDKALDKLTRLFADLADYHDFAPTRDNLDGHYQFANTACPGPYLKARLDDVARAAAALGGKPSPVNNPKPIKPFNPKLDKLAADGVWGPDTTAKAQFILGTEDDGVISNQTAAWKSQNPGLAAGWDWTGKEGDGGSSFVARHQAKLRERGQYKGFIDGKVGPQYFTALQRDLGTPVDGKVSRPSKMVVAFQKRLNAGRI